MKKSLSLALLVKIHEIVSTREVIRKTRMIRECSRRAASASTKTDVDEEILRERSH